MTGEDLDPANLTPEDMARLHAELQRDGMTPANAAEMVEILARLGSKLDLLRQDAADIRAKLTRMEARVAIWRR